MWLEQLLDLLEFWTYFLKIISLVDYEQLIEEFVGL